MDLSSARFMKSHVEHHAKHGHKGCAAEWLWLPSDVVSTFFQSLEECVHDPKGSVTGLLVVRGDVRPDLGFGLLKAIRLGMPFPTKLLGLLLLLFEDRGGHEGVRGPQSLTNENRRCRELFFDSPVDLIVHSVTHGPLGLWLLVSVVS
jgi:hypothetical protein